jgi:TPR repeat protein
MLSRRHVGPRERDEAIEWLPARADSGDVDALAQAAELLEEAGHPDEAIALFKWAAEVGDSEALVQAAGIWRRSVNATTPLNFVATGLNRAVASLTIGTEPI